MDLVDANHREIEADFDEEPNFGEEAMDTLDVLAQAGVAAKTVELVGQVLKNYYGSLRMVVKVELGNDAIGLGLRALYAFVDLLMCDDAEIVRDLVNGRSAYESENFPPAGRMKGEELERWARDLVFVVLRVVALSIVRKVASSLGSDQLKPTLAKLVHNDASVAYKMIEVALLLDGPEEIPRKKLEELARRLNGNALGFQVLRDLAALRVYRYPIGFKDKQWLAGALNFSLANQRAADLDKSRRLLSG